MGGYAFYVWPAYGVSALGLAGRDPVDRARDGCARAQARRAGAQRREAALYPCPPRASRRSRASSSTPCILRRRTGCGAAVGADRQARAAPGASARSTAPRRASVRASSHRAMSRRQRLRVVVRALPQRGAAARHARRTARLRALRPGPEGQPGEDPRLPRRERQSVPAHRARRRRPRQHRMGRLWRAGDLRRSTDTASSARASSARSRRTCSTTSCCPRSRPRGADRKTFGNHDLRAWAACSSAPPISLSPRSRRIRPAPQPKAPGFRGRACRAHRRTAPRSRRSISSRPPSPRPQPRPAPAQAAPSRPGSALDIRI